MKKKRDINYYNIYILDLINFIKKEYHLNYLNNQINVFLKNTILKNNRNKQKNILIKDEDNEKCNEIYNLIVNYDNFKTKFNKNILYAYLWKIFLTLDEKIKKKYKDINKKIKNYEDYLNVVNETNILFIDLYVDGSYREKEKKYSYGFIIVDNNNVMYEEYGVGVETNNCNLKHISGELYAVIEGIKYIKCKKLKKIKLYYDFEGIADLVLLQNCKPRNETTKKYNEIMKNYINNNIDIEIVFIKVKSHSGNKYNDKVHNLCNSAFQKKNNKIQGQN
jgi:ribonuclease HI